MSRAKCLLLFLVFALATASARAQPGTGPGPFGPSALPGGTGIMGGDPRFGGPVIVQPQLQQPVQMPEFRPPIDVSRYYMPPLHELPSRTPSSKSGEWPAWAGWPVVGSLFAIMVFVGFLCGVFHRPT
jgi:hypothetical protein